MKNVFKLFGFIAIAAVIALTGCPNNNNKNGKESEEGTVGVPVTNPLHSKWPFFVGAAAPGSAFNSSNGQYSLLGHFNVLVAENDMKPESIMPSQWQNWQSSPVYNASNAYRWTEADKLVNYAQANNTKIRGHVLFWHEQIPEAFFRTGNLTSAYVSKEVLYTRMEQHVKTVFQKYKGKILWWDVANECVNDQGNPRVEGGANVGNSDGKSGFTAVMTAAGVTGDACYEWIANAFKYARKYADENGGQNVKLFLTEYGIEGSGAKQNGFLRLVDYLIANGAPIDGVGIQGHTDINAGDGGYVSSLSSVIDKIATRINPVSGKNMTVQVCELDISLFVWSDSRLTLPTSELNTGLQKQATMYRNLFDMFAEKHSAGKFDGVLVWGLADGHSWLNDFPVSGRTNHPLLFDRQYKPKSAFNSLITGVAGETLVGSFTAYAPNSYTSLSSSVAYQIVNLPGESRTNVMKVVNPGEWAAALYSLSAYKDTSVTVTFSAEVKRVGAEGTLNWQINNSDYPSVNSISNATAGTWHTMNGTWTGTLSNDPSIYLNTYQNNSESTTYYVDNFSITVK
ncbi:MAG: endo-1,4-beta-xylanase [Treponema sp.]|jgi:endo-1,4-beta-xylanase|nr:endo-1,4-beta-xylanase [Treponema sp.]